MTMRKILSLLFLSAIVLACSKEDVEPGTPLEEATMYTVTFKMGGEITDISTSPLGTRSAPNDLYGIQVYSKAPNDETEKPYAYGLFDDPTAISIKLMSGYTYHFICTMVVDGKNKIMYYSDVYDAPFIAGKPTQVSSQFIYSSITEYTTLKYGTILGREGYIGIPNVDRYYGETSGFVPSENGVVNINMKRTAFGVKVVAQDFTEGQLTIQLQGAPTLTLIYPNTEIQEIYTFAFVAEAYYFNGDYTENLDVQINWIKNDGVSIPIATQTVAFTRNKLTTINVKVADVLVNSGIGINLDNTGMIEGDTINVDGSTPPDTPVNPNP